jgi:hypothetical protein
MHLIVTVIIFVGLAAILIWVADWTSRLAEAARLERAEERWGCASKRMNPSPVASRRLDRIGADREDDRNCRCRGRKRLARQDQG